MKKIFLFLFISFLVSNTSFAKKSGCTGVEMFRKLLDSGEAGDNIGALRRGV